MQVDYLIVGAGLAGSVLAERLARGLGRRVLLVERRDHVGGNCHDRYDDHGVLIQQYGPHIFHTPSEEVWRYVNRFCAWSGYQHRVLGFIDGQLVPIPFNFNSLDALLPPTLARRLEVSLLKHFAFGRKVPILELRKVADPDLQLLADLVYEKVFVHYTHKQWATRLEDLTPAAADRVPVHLSRDDRYFQDPFQGIPQPGFHRFFENLLDHPNIHVLLRTDWKDVAGQIRYKRLIWTGALDAFFDHRFGVLPYRTLDFRWEHLPEDQFQPVSVVNYPNDHAFTRITEYKHFTGQRCPGTTLSREFPRWADQDGDIPYYPMPTGECIDMYRKYAEEAKKVPEVVFLGRLAEYRYYDMDDVVAAALERFGTLAREDR